MSQYVSRCVTTTAVIYVPLLDLASTTPGWLERRRGAAHG